MVKLILLPAKTTDFMSYQLINPKIPNPQFLRTTWADHIFVLAGGADPGGNLRMVSPLALDIYDPPMTCPPTQMYSRAFLLRYDAAPLGAGYPPAPPPPGDEYVDWPDPVYPYGFPNDDHSFNENEYALWDITSRVPDICNDEEFKMRVRVTDHVQNWRRSGVMDMSIGVEGIDSGGKIETLSFYAESGPGIPEYLYVYCDNDCNHPTSCIPANNTASSIEMRDEDGNCVLHLVAKCAVLKQDKFPNSIAAAITSNEPYVPNNSLGLIIKSMWPVNPETAEIFDTLFGSTETSLCYYQYYVCAVGVTDNAGDLSKLFVSHSDEAYPGYPESDECEDYTIIYDPSEEPIDFVRYAQNYHYGYKRGQSYECHSYDNSYFSEDRCIQVGGMQIVFASVDNKTAPRPVQSAADLIIVASHGVYHNNLPTGIDGNFDGRLNGCFCPPENILLRDSPYFSPLLINLGQGFLYDNDFQENANDNWDFDGEFWQAQPSHDRVTWVIFLGCGILNTSPTFGYTPLDEWRRYITEIHKADAICGYASKGPGNLDVVDFIASNFSYIMEFNFTENEGYYLCDPPEGYFFRPIRAWMEANCKALNEFNWDLEEGTYNEDHTNIVMAKAIDFEGTVWMLEQPPRTKLWKITTQ